MVKKSAKSATSTPIETAKAKKAESAEPTQVSSEKPTIPAKTEAVATAGKPKGGKAFPRAKEEHGYVYIGHLPHGFFEEQIKAYFSQFGRVLRVRLARSKKTGNYKGYGFIEFKHKEVAQIAAETMNNYLMFNKILKCQIIPKDKLHKMTFRNARRIYHPALESTRRKKFNRNRSAKELEILDAKQNKRMAKKQKKLAAMGIKLDLKSLKSFTVETKESKAKDTTTTAVKASKISKAEAKQTKSVAVDISKKSPVTRQIVAPNPKSTKKVQETSVIDRVKKDDKIVKPAQEKKIAKKQKK